MTATPFEEWFVKDFVPSVRKHLRRLGHEEKAILLLDNCPAHPGPEILVSKDKKIKAVFLPKNTTSKIQPLDQGIMANLKLLYRRQLIKKMLQDEREVEVYLKSITVKDALFMAADAWDAVKPTTIRHCWEKALPEEGSPLHDDDDDFMGFTAEEAAAAQTKFNEQLDSNTLLAELLLRWSEMDEDAPVALDTKDIEVVEEEEEEPEAATTAPVLPDLPSHRIPTASEALQGCEDVIKFGDSNPGLLDPAELHHLNNILRKIRDKATSKKKQMKLSDFFTTTNRD